MTSETEFGLPRLQALRRRESMSQTSTAAVTTAVEKARAFSMVSEESLIELAHQVRAILALNIPGDFVECGVWRGGASFLMADILRQAGVRDRRVWLFDSFAGLPAPQAIDGPAAMAYTEQTDNAWYHDNCQASLEEVQRSASELGLASYTTLVKGWFDQTLPTHRQRIGPIALLRIDGDWYASVRCCLDHLYDQVVEGGLIVLDDYYAWDGCAIAVHEFLAARRLAHRIESSEGSQYYHAAIFRKGAGKTTWKWIHQLYLIAEDIAAVVPPGDTFILVDQAQFGNEVAGGRRVLPFLEHDGQYWGPPPDDETGIRELERLRQAGAHFMVFGWPAFWWLEYYAGLHRYLRTAFPCVLHNERVLVFDVR